MPRKGQEIDTLRRQNRWYIADDPYTIQLVPYPEVASPAGGRTRAAGTPRTPQIVRLIPADRTRTTTNAPNTPSTQTEVSVKIIGDADLQIEEGDRFMHNGLEYRVTDVQPASSAPYLRRATACATPKAGQ